ncbi:right-handed parallel beta-helix repeat-containing protein [Mucilaginibacter myungsuensis]|uniref:Right-handed parallel beta-helix repeat-containing protein n=1 Tax=Mucilaginibacter myungsuensis TaxID=649104 RepID=A0A929L146_9SPHI|nr:right-handed parallel beta-helix repeat-containing protein [Mucilaginibacter myungsuensis]MBE9664213.1 right-handed parallel beta-helix repeat-containing protein [Mucilaginibacter myungsuensis]MDN3599915.1 right-handed parallel beta-helix repeat-containing protein [Mucilaginibacter myungsuensis]
MKKKNPNTSSLTRLVLLFPLIFLQSIAYSKSVNIKDFGAIGNGTHDDTRAFVRAINTGNIIYIPKGVYKIIGQVKFSGISNKTIIAQNAIIKNFSDTKGLLAFINGQNISINGGTWGRNKMPVEESKNAEDHVFTFVNIKNLKVQSVTIKGSGQMGISMIAVTNAAIKNNHISDCFRDGIYAHYSAKLIYSGNHLENIKDDAMSIHDYGINEQKTVLQNQGYAQAGHATITGNTVKNAYQGFSSIGCADVVISYNKITNTVNSGIAVFNSEKLFPGGTARVNKVSILYNQLSYNGGKQTILKKTFINNGQLTSGRSAIFVGVNDKDDLINNPDTRLRNIKIENNIIHSSYVNGCYVAQVDGLSLINNSFTNCDIDRSNYSGRIVEVSNCTQTTIRRNKIIDNRKTVLHDAGYDIINVKGNISGWTVRGHIDKVEGYIR